MRILNCALVIAPLIAPVCIGCESADSTYDATVQGTVTIDGELANRGSVTFHPVDNGPTAYATIQKDGSYALRTGQGPIGKVDGGQVHSGDYIVTVVVTEAPAAREPTEDSGPPIPGLRITAAKHAKKKSSDLRYKVDPGANVISLELERASEDETDEIADAEAEDAAGKDSPSAEKSEEDAKIKHVEQPVEVETPTQQPTEDAKP
jgi:hypothetical protein